MIRLTTSCDICGTEKKQTNHWFVAYEQNGELRISGWKSRFTKKNGSRHLCGQTCLHKLVDEFMVKTIEGDRAAAGPEAMEMDAAESRKDSGPGSNRDPHNDPRNGQRNDVREQSEYGMGVDQRVDHRYPDPRWIENRAAESRAVEARAPESRVLDAHSNMPAQSSAPSWTGTYEDEYGSSARLIPTPPVSDARPSLQVEPAADEASRYAPRQWRATTAWERERERSLRSDTSSRRHKI